MPLIFQLAAINNILLLLCNIKYISAQVLMRGLENVTPTILGQVNRGGALVESMPFDRRVVGLNPALATT